MARSFGRKKPIIYPYGKFSLQLFYIISYVYCRLAIYGQVLIRSFCQILTNQPKLM